MLSKEALSVPGCPAVAVACPEESGGLPCRMLRIAPT